MADLTIRFYSDVLKRDVSFLMQIPNDIRRDWPRDDLKCEDRPMKTLFLLRKYVLRPVLLGTCGRRGLVRGGSLLFRRP